MAEDKRFTFEDYEEIRNFLQGKTKCRPKILIICGSGLGGLADRLEDSYKIVYEDIPKFPVSTVKGHVGQLVFGKLGDKEVVCMQGRFHLYEGYPAWKVAIPIRVMSLMGVKTVIVTNAAGGINRSYNVGDFMMIKDHINMMGMTGGNPLMGPNDERFGPRFPPMSKAYDRTMREQASDIAKELGLGRLIRDGVYCSLSGPSFETPAELRFLQTIGADAVGMSTCPEVVVAKHCGLRVFGMSLITNKCILDYDNDEEANHEEVLETGRQRASDMQNLIARLVERMSNSEKINNGNGVI
ncbi:purine nucleoside phosphorylase-like [Ptychodera flava]|uniref:purine nucleoside phosphorylase-like n=1 Tax=Ptychodera flava TaxID=63121 RepID=UPI00396A6197